MENNANIPACLKDQLNSYIEDSARTITHVCRRHHISKETQEAFIADIRQLMQGKWAGYIATTNQMDEIAAATDWQTWGRTLNPAVGIIGTHYINIADIVTGRTRLNPIGLARAAQAYTFAKHLGKDTAEMLTEANTAMLLYFILIAGEVCETTEEDLYTLFSLRDDYQPLNEKNKRKIIAQALDSHVQRKAWEQEINRETTTEDIKPLKVEAKKTTLPTATPRRLKTNIIEANKDRSVKYYQNFVYELGKGVEVAEGNGGFRSITQALVEKGQNVEDMKNDRRLHATKQDIATAEAQITTTNAITQTWRGCVLLPQMILPQGGSANTQEYKTTPRAFTIIATGTKNPSQTQVNNCMKALNFLSTQRARVIETGVGRVRKKGKDGKVNYEIVPKTTYTVFSPCVTTFYGEYDERTQAEKANYITINIHPILINGCSGEKIQVNDGKKEETLPIMMPQVHRIPLWKVYKFTTEEEIRFQAAVLSKGNCSEDKLLEAVFDYKGKILRAEMERDDAFARYSAVSDSTTATEEKKQAAYSEYLKAREKSAECLTKHRGRDIERLQAFFQRAQETGLLKYWSKKPMETEKGKFKYEWGRFTEDEKKQHSSK